MSVANNENGKMPGGITGRGFRKGQSGNSEGVPGWVSRARAAMRDELYPLAERHLKRILSGKRPADSTPEEDALYAEVTQRDRSEAARLVYEYSIPKPKTQVGLKHEGKGDTVVVEVKTYTPEEKA